MTTMSFSGIVNEKKILLSSVNIDTFKVSLWPIVVTLGVQYFRPKLKFYLFPLTRPTLKKGPT